MKDCWYADNRDLIKWGALLRLATQFSASRIVQIAFYRPYEFGHLLIDGQKYELPAEVIAHFRNVGNIRSITSEVEISVFDTLFSDRGSYVEAAIACIRGYPKERCIVFLDPDTGLQPAKTKPDYKHVLNCEVARLFENTKPGDIFAFYQHQTNRAAEPWIEPKRQQLANALTSIWIP